MSTPYNQFGTRTGMAAELPEQLVNELITGTIRASTVLSLGKKVPTTTRDSRVPVLTELPEAYWVTPPDSGLEQTTTPVFSNEILVAEELATICVIPSAVIEDSNYDLSGAMEPLLVQSMAKAVDLAVMFGINAPASWTGPSMVADATAVGNVVSDAVMDPIVDNPSLVLRAAGLVAQQGYGPNGACVSPGWEFRAAQLRTPALIANPIGADTPFPLLLAGMGIHTNPVTWKFAQADAIVADWTKVLVGIRKDLEITSFTSGVISDNTGAVVMNLIQQRAVAFRLVMRIGFLLAKPPTDAADLTTGLPLDAAHRSPVGIVKNNVTTGEYVAPYAGTLKGTATRKAGK